MICASVYLLVFIRILLVHLAQKILLIQPLNCGGDYQGQYLDASGLPFRANDDVVLCDVKGLLTIVISYCLADTTIQPE